MQLLEKTTESIIAPMPKVSPTAPRVISLAFNLWKAKEAREERRITQEEIIEQTGLAKMTARRFLEPRGDVSGSPLSTVAAFARYFGVSIGEVVDIDRETL